LLGHADFVEVQAVVGAACTPSSLEKNLYNLLEIEYKSNKKIGQELRRCDKIPYKKTAKMT
jgi:hypothetical protein